MLVSGAGGPPALSSVIQTALDHWELRIPIEEVTERPRSHYAGGSAILYLEPSTPSDVAEALRRRGYQIAQAESIGTASAFRCVEGLPRSSIQFGVGRDPRIRGLMMFEFGSN